MREQYVLDTFGLAHDELRDRYPDAFQWLHDRVKSERETKRGATKDSQEYADNWWLFAKTRSKFRPALTRKLAWPKTLAEQAQAVRAALIACAVPADAATLAKTFKSAKPDRISDLLETLASLGQARALPGDRFVAA